MAMNKQLRVASSLLLLLFVSLPWVDSFDANECDVYVFRTSEGAMWHCGDKLPFDWAPMPEYGFTGSSLYCDHSWGDNNIYLFPWISAHPDEWCDFMIATVRQEDEDYYPLTTNIVIGDTPGPNQWLFQTMVDWSCYMVENGVTTHAYIVDSQNGAHASTTTEECTRSKGYFDDWMFDGSLNIEGQWWGHRTEVGYEPQKNKWERCHYDDSKNGPNYVPELEVTYAECLSGYHCEYKGDDFALCLPDPHADHECCISWNNKCQNVGDCCKGSECNADGFCSPFTPQVYDDPPGICEQRVIKEEKKVWSRCHDYASGGQGDCAPGYLCLGSWLYAQCEVDPGVKNDCCKWEFDNSNPRPGDCCVGWYAHCNTVDPMTGKCTESQCIPGRETGVDENGNSMLDVHDRICTDPPMLMSYKEEINECTGAICGVWGDPHIITCDELHYDCQATGLFTVMRNHMFNIQGNFVHFDTPWGGASVTNDIVIDYTKNSPNDVPTMQFSFPNFTSIDENNPVYDDRSRVIGACPVMLYLDGVMVDISDVPSDGYLYGDASTDHSIKLNGFNQIDIKLFVGFDENGEKYYSNSILWIEGTGPFTSWSCIISYFICLPREEQDAFRSWSEGLLGTPNANKMDDWMAKDGQTLLIPTSNMEEESFNYCVDNWCVEEADSILTYEEGLSYEDYKCGPQNYTEFDVNQCENSTQIIADCADSPHPVTCQMEQCIGNPNVDDQLDQYTNDDDDGNQIEYPVYGDCANLGAGLSGSTGQGAFSATFPAIDSLLVNGFTKGVDNSLSVLVGGNFHCKGGAGFEGRGVFMGDMILEETGCNRLAATHHGSLIHPLDDSVCIEVGGDLTIGATFTESKFIMYEHGNTNKLCHLVYKAGCQLNGVDCPTTKTELEGQHVFTNGDFTQHSSMDLSEWEEEITLLQQKTNYWNTLEANGNLEVVDQVMTFGVGPDNNPVQIFKINPIEADVHNIVFKKELLDKTIMIIVHGDGDFNVPTMCFHPSDALLNDAPICGTDTFPPSLTSSIAWVFPTSGLVTMTGATEMMGSLAIPFGDLTFNASGHSGRMIVGGNLIMENSLTELHNYEFDPVSHPLPLGDDLSVVCEVDQPLVCTETYKSLTNETACPSRTEGVVRLLSSSAPIPESEPILYDIIFDPPADPLSSKTVKFRVDNPFTNHTDIYINHNKKVGNFAMDPICDTMPFTPGCNAGAPIFEVGCNEYEGVEAFAIVNLYFASNTDSDVVSIGSGGDVEINKCCSPPEAYDTDGYGIVHYAFEIKCTCPDTLTSS